MNHSLVRGVVLLVIIALIGISPVFSEQPSSIASIALIAINNYSGVDSVHGSRLIDLVEKKFTKIINQQTNINFVDLESTVKQLKKSGLESFYDAAPLCTPQDLQKIVKLIGVDQLVVLDINGYAEIKREKSKKTFQLLLGLQVIGKDGEEINISGEGFSDGKYDEAFNNAVTNLINNYLNLEQNDANSGNIRAANAPVIGNQMSKLYHLTDTHHRPRNTNVVKFNSRNDAEQQGYHPCPICFPSYKSFAYPDRNLEEELGARGCGTMEYYYRVEQNPELQARLEQIAAPLFKVSYRKNVDFKFRILDTNEINAFSSPNGYIYITKGIMSILESDDEIGFVIAHEMAHIEKKHAVISYRRAMTTAFLTSLFLAANNSKNEADDLLAIVMANAILKGYSQEMEKEADAVAVAHLKQAGKDYRAYELVMGKFIDMRQAKITAIEKIFATHPTPEKRIEHLDKLLQSYQTLQDKLAVYMN
ncbi:MAG TPA: M48 family metallopeptidase [Bacillota bacterium]